MPDKPRLDPGTPKRKADARRSTRFPTRFVGKLRAGDDSLPVNVRDISREGVMLAGERLPAPGRDVVLSAKKLEADAKVVWQRGQLCGLEFAAPVDPLEIVRQNVPELARFRRSSED